MDNESPKEIQDFVASRKTDVQFALPDMHHQNAAERAVRTWKNNFIVGLASLHPKFPSANWCRLIPQTKMTLNLICACRQNKALPAKTALYGELYFDAKPMAPPGTKAMIHENTGKRFLWAYHAIDAWYVGPAMLHYRCYTVVTADTVGERVMYMIKFEHHVVVIPRVTPTDRIIQATREISSANQHDPTMVPLEYIEAAQLLCVILQERSGPSSEGAKKITASTTSEAAKKVTPCTTSEGAEEKKTSFPSLPCITQDDNNDPNPADYDNTPILPH